MVACCLLFIIRSNVVSKRSFGIRDQAHVLPSLVYARCKHMAHDDKGQACVRLLIVLGIIGNPGVGGWGPGCTVTMFPLELEL